jgi:hypothetical protein
VYTIGRLWSIIPTVPKVNIVQLFEGMWINDRCGWQSALLDPSPGLLVQCHIAMAIGSEHWLAELSTATGITTLKIFITVAF